MLTTSFIRAFHGLRISRLLKKKKKKNSTKKRSNYLLTTKNELSHLKSGKGIWLFTLISATLPKCSHSNNKFGPMFKFLLGFGFPLKNT